MSVCCSAEEKGYDSVGKSNAAVTMRSSDQTYTIQEIASMKIDPTPLHPMDVANRRPVAGTAAPVNSGHGMDRFQQGGPVRVPQRPTATAPAGARAAWDDAPVPEAVGVRASTPTRVPGRQPFGAAAAANELLDSARQQQKTAPPPNLVRRSSNTSLGEDDINSYNSDRNSFDSYGSAYRAGQKPVTTRTSGGISSAEPRLYRYVMIARSLAMCLVKGLGS